MSLDWAAVRGFHILLAGRRGLTADPVPTVRQIAGYHRQRAEQLRQAGFGV